MRLASLERLAVALGDSKRLRILLALATGEANAITLSRRFGDISVDDVSYHLGVLTDECGLIEPSRSHSAGGGEADIYYCLVPSREWGALDLPSPIWNRLRVELLRTFTQTVAAELDAGRLDVGDQTTLTAAPITVDPKGMTALNGVLREAMERVKRIEVQSRLRLKRRSRGAKAPDAISAVVGLAAFPVVAIPEQGAARVG